MAQTLGLKFKRIQFTPDLMPSDITGTDIIEEDPDHGPSHVDVRARADVLRTCCWRTRSTARRRRRSRRCWRRCRSCPARCAAINTASSAPFFVLATQNPIELEGTYPLPEAQLDRFLFNTVLDYLTAEDELKVVDLTTTTHTAAGRDGDQRRRDSRFPATGAHDADRGIGGAVCGRAGARDAARPNGDAPDFVKKYVNFGASVRAAQFLVLGGKARALMHGRFHVAYEDIRALAAPILRHRVLLNFHAESDRLTTDEISAAAAGLEAGAARVE